MQGVRPNARSSTPVFTAATKLFAIEETGSHHRPAEGEQVQEASARKPRRNCRALMLDLPEVYTKTVQQQPKSTLDFVQQANKWSRDPDNFKGSEGEKPFKVSVMSGFKFPGNKTPTYVLLQCSSCAIEESTCSWRGVIEYSAQSSKSLIKAEGVHASKQRKASGVMTEARRATLKKTRARSALGRLVALNDEPDSPPTQRQEKARKCNEAFRQRRKAQAAAPEVKAFPSEHTCEDILDAMRAAGVLLECPVPPSDIEAADNRDEHTLYCLEYRSFRTDAGKTAFAAVFSTPALASALRMLDNPHHVKLGTDATFKDVFQDYCLIPLGVLSNQYVTSRQGGCKIPSWSSHVSPVLYALSSADVHQVYEMLFDGVSKLSLRTNPPYTCRSTGVPSARGLGACHRDSAACHLPRECSCIRFLSLMDQRRLEAGGVASRASFGSEVGAVHHPHSLHDPG